MSQRNRISAIALGVVIAALSWEAAAQNAPDVTADRPSIKDGRDEQANSENSRASDFSLPVRIIEDAEEAERASRREAEAAQRERDDLAAQQSVAESTVEIVVISWWQLGIATFGSIAVAFSLGLSAWAVIITSKTHGFTEALEQPLLGIKMPENEFTFAEGRLSDNEIFFRVINTGRSPAQIVSIRRCWDVTQGKPGFPEPIDPNNPGERGLEKPYPRFVGAGAETEGIWSQHVKLLKIPQGLVPDRIFFHGFIRYRDLSGRRFVSGFCYFLNPTERGESRFRFAWPGHNTERYHYHREESRI